MCGIGGIVFSESSETELQSRINLLNQAQHHRGPDGNKTQLFDGQAFCHQLLSMRDFMHSAQPILDPSGRYLLVYNGEIYNDRQLKSEFTGRYQFSGNTDSEVLLYHLIEKGSAGIAELDGMFAFAFYDSIKKTLLLARDALGVKPLFYSRSGNELSFASEIKGLKAQKKFAFNTDYALHYLLTPYFSGSEINPYSGIDELPAGTYAVATPNTFTIHRYFDWPEVFEGNESSYIRQLKAALDTGISQNFQADVPLGVFLSGGLDSSIILSRLRQAYPERDLLAFTITFPEHSSGLFSPGSIVNSDDLPFADRLAKQLKSAHHHVAMEQKMYSGLLDAVVKTNDLIPAWEQEMTQYRLSEYARRYVKGVLVGDAADESCYGYYFLLNDEVLQSRDTFLNYFGYDFRIQFLNTPSQKRAKEMHRDLFQTLLKDRGLTFSNDIYGNRKASNHLIRKLWLSRLLHNGDIHTMAHGLEARVPFADKSVVVVTGGYNPARDVSAQTEKYLLRQAYRNDLSSEFIERKKSALPRDPRLMPLYTDLLKHELKDAPETFSQSVNMDFLNKWLSLCNDSEQHRMMAFNLLMLLKWQKSSL